MQQAYSACAFDIDGTLTVRGEEYIPAFMHDTLAHACMKTPMAVCTARNLGLAFDKLASVFPHAADPSYCQINCVFICENGSIGYFYDATTKNYREFFRVAYPYEAKQRELLFARIKNRLEGKLGESFMNEVSMAFRPLNFDDANHAAVAQRSNELAEMIKLELASSDPKRALKIGDSGIGVNVFPYTGDKVNGLKEFASFLTKFRGINFGEKVREIVVIGDQPQPGGNDDTFLGGEYGTPFTVGEVNPSNLYPLPVYDSAGKILTGPEGTAYLLDNLKFRNI